MEQRAFILAACLMLSPLAYACDSNIDPPKREEVDASGKSTENQAKAVTARPACDEETMIGLPATIYMPDDDQEFNFEDYHDVIREIQKYLDRHPSVGLMLVGNTDERGTNEINLALGLSYADKVRKNLLLRGFPMARLKSFSLGEEKPVDTGHTPEAWAKNRRVVIIPFLME
jgi:peptidoglycan-associated lipoprotein